MGVFYELLGAELSRFWGLARRGYEAGKGSRLAARRPVAATGAGDSYAAAVAWRGVEPRRVRAVDPLDMLASGFLGACIDAGCVVAGLSVGGVTRSVVEAVVRFKMLGGRAVAFTARRLSPLGLACDEVIILPYSETVMGVGAARHAVMLAALAGASGGRIEEWDPLQLPQGRGLLDYQVFLGVGEAAASAMYASLKTCEVFGECRPWYTLEQFIHAPVYTYRGGVRLLFFRQSMRDERVDEVLEGLRSAGFIVEEAPAVRGEPWSTVIGQAYLVLELLRRSAEKLGVATPSYRGHERLRDLTELIYYV